MKERDSNQRSSWDIYMIVVNKNRKTNKQAETHRDHVLRDLFDQMTSFRENNQTTFHILSVTRVKNAFS